MSGTTKIGVEVDEETYEQFRQFVIELTGKERGVLGEHLARAMRQYVESAESGGPAERVEQDLATVNRNVAENRELLKELATAVEGVEADGGARALSIDETTHTHRDESSSTSPERSPPSEPPHPKASRSKKAEWLAAEFEIADGCEIPRQALASKVDDEYAFGENATEALVDAAAERLDLRPHPERGEQFLVDETRFDEILDEQADETADEFDDLDAGHPEADD